MSEKPSIARRVYNAVVAARMQQAERQLRAYRAFESGARKDR